MTDHPCKDLTQTQREAFEQIAISQPPQCGWRSIDALLKAGVIERGKDDVRRDAMGFYRIPHFFVPLIVHMQWCDWCSEQPENQEALSPPSTLLCTRHPNCGCGGPECIDGFTMPPAKQNAAAGDAT